MTLGHKGLLVISRKKADEESSQEQVELQIFKTSYVNQKHCILIHLDAEGGWWEMYGTNIIFQKIITKYPPRIRILSEVNFLDVYLRYRNIHDTEPTSRKVGKCTFQSDGMTT